MRPLLASLLVGGAALAIASSWEGVVAMGLCFLAGSLAAPSRLP